MKIAFYSDMPLILQFLPQLVWTLIQLERVYFRPQISLLHLEKILSLCEVISKTSLLQNFCPPQYVVYLMIFIIIWLKYKLELSEAYVAIIFPFLDSFFLFPLKNTQWSGWKTICGLREWSAFLEYFTGSFQGNHI